MVVVTVVWGIVAAVFLALAVRARSVVHAPTAVGAIFAAASSLLGVGLIASLFLFVLVALIGRWVVRPVVREQAAGEARVRPGAGSLVGKTAVVVERVSNEEAIGCVRIEDELWAARTPDAAAVIAEGDRVEVIEVRGPTAIVEPLPKG